LFAPTSELLWNVTVTTHITLLTFYGARVNINAFVARNVMHVYKVILAGITYDVTFIVGHVFCVIVQGQKQAPKVSTSAWCILELRLDVRTRLKMAYFTA
jgi:hypothetical protein